MANFLKLRDDESLQDVLKAMTAAATSAKVYTDEQTANLLSLSEQQDYFEQQAKPISDQLKFLNSTNSTNSFPTLIYNVTKLQDSIDKIEQKMTSPAGIHGSISQAASSVATTPSAPPSAPVASTAAAPPVTPSPSGSSSSSSSGHPVAQIPTEPLPTKKAYDILRGDIPFSYVDQSNDSIHPIGNDLYLGKTPIDVTKDEHGNYVIELPDGEIEVLTPGLKELLTTDLSNPRKRITDEDIRSFYFLAGETGCDTGGEKFIRIKDIHHAIHDEGKGKGKEKEKIKQFGQGLVDTELLLQDPPILSIKSKDGKILRHCETTPGVRHLMTTRRIDMKSAGKRYNMADVEEMHRLAKMAGKSITASSSLSKLVSPDHSHHFIIDGDKMLDELEVIIGEVKAGNKSAKLSNKGQSFADKLLKEHMLTKAQHQQIMRILTQ
jgi:hypothetical protein